MGKAMDKALNKYCNHGMCGFEETIIQVAVRLCGYKGDVNQDLHPL
jgi:hypothetical protein